MPHKKLGITLFSLIVLFALALSACGAPAAAPAVEEAAPAVEEEAPAAEPILEVVGTDQTLSFSMAELQALPATEGQAGMISSTGAITPPIVHKGISLKDLVELLGGMDKSMGLYVEAVDGYGITFSYDQVMSGDFITYDPVTGIEISVEGPLTAILAYERDGKAMDPVQDGQLRVVAVGPEADNLIDGHWAVKWVNYLELKSVAANWFLHLEGVLTEEMDRATFESGSSPHCHLKSWTDENGDEWMGIPLWYLVGRVDDEVRHEGRAFDEDLAEAGYVITVTAADGYSVELASQDASFNDEWIVAAQVNGEPLSDKNYPLRLVGEGLSTGQMVGAIESIVLDLEARPEAAAAPETPPPAADAVPNDVTGDLVIIGSVAVPAGLCLEDVAALEQTTVNAQHPKKDTAADYSGVLLSTLFAGAQPFEDAEIMRITADDGYQVEVPAADVLACEDCLLTLTDDSGLMTVMPGFESSSWVKGVVSLEFVGGAAREMEGDLIISGMVDFVMPFQFAELQDMDVVTINTKHPKKDEMVDYQGVRLNDLLAMAKPRADAKTVKLIASDGYAIEVPLADVLACADCLIAFDDDDSLKSVMPGMDSMFWVKDVVSIEIQ